MCNQKGHGGRCHDGLRQRVQIAAPAPAQAVSAVALRVLRTCERRLSGEQSGPLSGCNGSRLADHALNLGAGKPSSNSLNPIRRDALRTAHLEMLM
jgi:hypothetical protein